MRVLETRDPPESFVPRSIVRRKLYELVERRNEWTDGHGSTDLVSRGRNYADLNDVDSREVLQALAEGRRKQGSVFSLRVIPVLVLKNENHCLLVGERRTDRPLAGLMKQRKLRSFDNLPWSAVISALMDFCLDRSSGFILSLNDLSDIERLEHFSSEDGCFNFESRSCGSAYLLRWIATGQVSTDELDDFWLAVRRKSASAKQRRRGATASA